LSYTQRTADYVITKAYQTFKGKAVAPASTTTKYQAMLGILDSVQHDWADEPGIEWNSLYDVIATGTVTATNLFDLDDDIHYISKRQGDSVTLTKGTQTVEVLLVNPDQLYANRDNLACAQTGRKLRFSKPFTADSPYIGYTINVPAIQYVDDITSGSSLVQCDNPLYLADMLAAEVARNDTVKGGQYNNILDKAAEKMDRMKQDNGGQEDSIPRASFASAGETWN
jgi:hypothetical protein